MTPIWAKQMIGTAVRGRTGEVIGEINDFVFDSSFVQLQFVLVSSGDFLGIGGKLFPVPLPSLVLDTENECFVLDADKERLRDGPSFDGANALSRNAGYRDEIFRYYGVEARAPHPNERVGT